MLSWIIPTYCGCPEACLMSSNLAITRVHSNAEIDPSAQESSDLESESEIANEEDSD